MDAQILHDCNGRRPRSLWEHAGNGTPAIACPICRPRNPRMGCSTGKKKHELRLGGARPARCADSHNAPKIP